MSTAQIKEEFVDITDILSGSESKIVQSTLKQGGVALAVKLPSFKGLLKRELIPNIRLGTEMAKRAVFWGRVGGIFHSDELPAYGINSSHIEEVVKSLGCGELDGFVIVADNLDNAKDGLRAVAERAREAVERVPEETRAANADGTTGYLRPRPVAGRMYPVNKDPAVQT